MKISESWLREWINPELTSEALAHQMTMTGMEVDTLEPVAGDFTGVVIGFVVSTQPHPNADKLTCCEVDVGEDEPLKIVCGAKNVREGLKVAVATVGAVLPGNFKIKAAKLRGEPSKGMICAASELGLKFFETNQSGIMELPKNAPVGQDFRLYFLADDQVIDIEMTPNRGDCLSIQGVARDLAVTTQSPFKPIDIHAVSSDLDAVKNVKLAHAQACPRYVGRVIKGIDNTVKTPMWMQLRLQRSGIRSINPVVDICNYVMMELGQPMHGFDLSKLEGDVCVRTAREGETLQLLDETNITLQSSDLVISDDKKPLALAGIMGGLESGVVSQTTDVFLEAAYFTPKNICLSARRHGLSTDSSYRFERGVDPELPLIAIVRACELIKEITGGQFGEVVDVVEMQEMPKRAEIVLSCSKIERVLGIEVAPEKVEAILTALGMVVKATDSGWLVVPPSYRFDINLDVEVIEELVRVIGYDQIPAAPMKGTLAMLDCSESCQSSSALMSLLTSRGFYECISYSFISPELHQLTSDRPGEIVLDNPISKDLSVMRPSLFPGLLNALAHNIRHQVDRMRLFEVGLCFTKSTQVDDIIQKNKLGLLICGSALPEQWGAKKSSVDFYDLKGDVEALLAATGYLDDFKWVAGEMPALHPGRTAFLEKNGQVVGCLGECHPNVAAALGIKQPIILFECDYDALSQARLPEYQNFSKFPAVRRDLAWLLEESISASDLCNLIREKSGELLKNVQVFDVYQGKGIEVGKKSVALGLTFQDASRTLVDEEINAIIHDVVTVLEREMNATLRA